LNDSTDSKPDHRPELRSQHEISMKLRYRERGASLIGGAAGEKVNAARGRERENLFFPVRAETRDRWRPLK